MTKQLYKIADDFLELEQALEDGLIDQQAFDDTIEAVKMDFSQKIGNLLAIRAKAKAKKDAVSAEIKRLQAMGKACDRSVDHIEEYIRSQMARTETAKVEDAQGLRTVTLAATAPKVLVKPESFDPADLPAKYVEKSTAYKVDFAAIKNDLSADDGLMIGEFHLTDGKRRLTIK